MKAGARVLGIAESYRRKQSTLAGVVVRANRVVDGFVFGSCTVGGTDATAAICALFERLGREDVRLLLVAGIAPAWFNILDLHAINEATDRPVLSVTFEESDGLEAAISEHFEGEDRERRLETYRTQPPRRAVSVGAETIFVRTVGLEPDRTQEIVRTLTPDGGRPEPVRIARQAARAADRFRRQ